MGEAPSWQDRQLRNRIILGVVLVLGPVGLGLYEARWMRSAFQGPVPITLGELERLEDPASLPNPWVSFAFEEGIDTGVALRSAGKGEEVVLRDAGRENIPVKGIFVLIRLGDRWLLAEVPPNFRGDRIVGSLDRWWLPLHKKVLGKVQERVPGFSLAPYQLDAVYDYKQQCVSTIILIAIFSSIGLWQIGSAVSESRKRMRMPPELRKAAPVRSGAVVQNFAAMQLLRATRTEAERDPVNGEYLLRYTNVARGIVLVMFAFFLVIFGGAMSEKPEDVWPLLIGALFLFSMTGALLAETLGVSIRIGPDGIVGRAPWRMPRSIAWEEIELVRYNDMLTWFVIRGADGTKLRISALISGTEALASEIRARLEASVYQDADRAFLAMGI